MEDSSFHPMLSNNETAGIVRVLRDVPPAHYILKIESFSLLAATQVEKYESGDFEASGYKWRLSIYPNGNRKRNGNDHISLYLTISATNNLPLGWEIDVNFKMFVFDQIRDKYLTIQDADGRLRRLHGMTTECGFAQLLSLKTFKDPSNGYLLGDCCVFGVEVFAIKVTGNGECLSMLKEPRNSHHVWKIDKFSELDQNFYESEVFTVEGQKWKLRLCPKGDPKRTPSCISVYLMFNGSETLPLRKFYAKFKLRIRDQIHNNHKELTADHWFDTSGFGWGFPKFLTLSDLHNTSKGFLVDDMLILEGQLDIISVAKSFS